MLDPIYLKKRFIVSTFSTAYFLISYLASYLLKKYVFVEESEEIVLLYGVIHYLLKMPVITIVFPMINQNNTIMIIALILFLVIFPVFKIMKLFKVNKVYFYFSIILVVTSLICNCMIMYLFTII